MKVLAVIANDFETSRSAKVAHRIIDSAREAGHEVKIYALNEMPLLGCRNCRACRKNNCDCVIQDALQPYFDDLHEAGAVIVASPNYNSQPSGSVLTFMNRHYCLLDAEKQPRLDHDIKLISVFAQGASEGHVAYSANYEWFCGCFRTKRLIDSGRLVIGGDSDLSDEGRIMTEAVKLGKEL